MKTLKLFFVVLLLGLLALASTAQPPKTVTCETLDWPSFEFPCLGETLSGSVEMCFTLWNNKEQIKLKGYLVGETSGDTYTVTAVGNTMLRPLMNGDAENGTMVQTLTVCLDGMPVLTIHATYHYTINSNGVEVAVVDNYSVDCY
jgi:hypothetical protein